MSAELAEEVEVLQSIYGPERVSVELPPPTGGPASDPLGAGGAVPVGGPDRCASGQPCTCVVTLTGLLSDLGTASILCQVPPGYPTEPATVRIESQGVEIPEGALGDALVQMSYAAFCGRGQAHLFDVLEAGLEALRSAVPSRDCTHPTATTAATRTTTAAAAVKREYVNDDSDDGDASNSDDDQEGSGGHGDTAGYLQHLPVEVLERVFRHLDVRSLSRAAATCRALYGTPWPVADFGECGMQSGGAWRTRLSDAVVRCLLWRHPVVISLDAVDCSQCDELEQLIGLPSVRHFRVSNMQRTSWLARALVAGMHRNPRLKVLALDGCFLQRHSLQVLLPQVAACRGLHTLRLPFNAFRAADLDVLIPLLLEERDCPLALDLAGNSLSNLFQANRLLDALGATHALAELSLRGCRLTHADAQALCCVLHFNTSIRGLDLSMNELNDQSAGHVAELLELNAALQRLSLQGNLLDARSAERLAEALPLNHALETLSLADNDLGPAGLAALGRALAGNSALRHLDLSETCTGSEPSEGPEFSELRRGLKRNRHLVSLNLAGNTMTSTQARSLVDLGRPLRIRLSAAASQQGSACHRVSEPRGGGGGGGGGRYPVAWPSP